MKKISIMALGLQPRPVVHFVATQKPQECHLIASAEGLRYVAREQGYTKDNLAVVKEAGRQAKSKLFIYECDAFDPESIGDAVSKILERVKIDDEVDINYSGGTQAMSLVLGSVAVVLSRIMPVKVLYSTRTPNGKEKLLDHTKVVKELFRRLYELVPT